MRKFYPTPEERAELVIKKLEQIIKDNKEKMAQKALTPVEILNTPQGMSYKKWQDAAKVEMALAIRNAVLDEVKNNQMFQAFLMTTGICLTTLGFLGAAIAWGSIPKVLVATASSIIGIVLLVIGATWLLSGSIGEIIANRRQAKIARLNNLNEQVKKMENYLTDKKNHLKNEMENLE